MSYKCPLKLCFEEFSVFWITHRNPMNKILNGNEVLNTTLSYNCGWKYTGDKYSKSLMSVYTL